MYCSSFLCLKRMKNQIEAHLAPQPKQFCFFKYVHSKKMFNCLLTFLLSQRTKALLDQQLSCHTLTISPCTSVMDLVDSLRNTSNYIMKHLDTPSPLVFVSCQSFSISCVFHSWIFVGDMQLKNMLFLSPRGLNVFLKQCSRHEQFITVTIPLIMHILIQLVNIFRLEVEK